MERKQLPTLIVILIGIGVVAYFFMSHSSFDLPEGESVKVNSPGLDEMGEDNLKEESLETEEIDFTPTNLVSSREIFETDGVRHSIPIDDIRRGCFGRDCIPSIDEPEFVEIEEADRLFRTAGEQSESVIGIALSINGVDRFYPFNMLVTREIVNDVVAGQPVAVTYCPLCGTGIVFERVYEEEILEFGVSGLLWQSNLLMYNRADSEEEISLWSQVLGEAVLGNKTGAKLAVIPSDVIQFEKWRKTKPNGEVLNTGRIGDPYNGNYYEVATGFNPDFDEANSPIEPTTYVFGIEVDGKYKAYVRDSLPLGVTDDTFNNLQLRIDKSEDGKVRISSANVQIPIVTGFWFSWIAAHPETELYK